MERQIEPELMLDEEQVNAFNLGPKDYGITGFINMFNLYVPDKIKKVVDLGCGTGEYLLALRKKYHPMMIVGYDGSPAMVKLAKKNVQGRRIHIRHSMFADITDQADCVVSTNTLHHMYDPQVLWNTAKRISNRVLVMDFVRPESEKIAQDISDTISIEPGKFRQDCYQSLLASFSEEELRKQIAGTDLNLVLINDLDFHPKLQVAIIHGQFTND